MSQVSSIREIVACWPSRAAMAADMNAVAGRQIVTVHQVQKWAEKQSIPARYHLPVIEAATARGYGVTADLIVRLHAAPAGGEAAA